MTESDFADILWEIYLNSCICHLDYYSKCTCEANDTAGYELGNLLGPDWHNIMRLKYK